MGWEWTGKEKKEGKVRKDGGEGKEGDFQQYEILTASMLRSANLYYRAKFRAGRSISSEDMAVYWIFQNGGRPQSWIFKSWKFWLPIPFGEPKCVIMPNFVQIDRIVAEIWLFTFFSRWWTSAILDFHKLENLTALTLLIAKMRHRVKLCANRSRRCGNMAVFRFSR